MEIAQKLDVNKYYIARNENDAVSIWENMDSAMDCLERFKKFRAHELKNINGILRVGPEGRKWVLVLAKLK
jgi:hypothetical protein